MVIKMTTGVKPKSHEKCMERNKTRLILQILNANVIVHNPMRRPWASCTAECDHVSSSRLMTSEKELHHKNRQCAIGTIADHRMTNNNRIRKWHMFAVILWVMFIVDLTVVHGYPEPAPVRVSHSYTNTAKNNILSSSTPTSSRSTTLTAAFLPSDAVSSSYSVTKPKNSNNTTSNSNANYYNSRSVSANRKDYSSSSTLTSIDRPFYTKITGNDAVSKPSYYSRGRIPTKKPKKKTKGSKYSRTSTTEKPSANNDDDDNDYEYNMPHTTEKSYHPTKLSLEPFFNFLTSLASASREVAMSKEQQQNHHPAEQSSSSSNKYSPSYETINQSMREGAKRSKKSKYDKGKKGSKGRKGNKKEKGSKRHQFRSEEEDEEQTSKGPIPIPLPNPIIDSAEMEENDDSVAESSPGLHILDVLRTPMMPAYESPSQQQPEPLMAPEFYEKYRKTKSVAATKTNSSSNPSGNPPSGRANMNKGQGYAPFDNYGAPGTNISGTNSQREQQTNEGDPMDSFHDQNMEIQAEESINHAQILPSPYGMSNGAGGLGTSHKHQNIQHLQYSGNDASSSTSQVSSTQSKSPEFPKSETDMFGQPFPQGKDDLVSKYPTTFVYKPQPSGPPPPGSRPFISQSPVGGYGPPPSSRLPFRVNKLRPNLHSYYDSSYHNYAGAGESFPNNNMFGMRHPFRPPHFKPHSAPHLSMPPPLASPPRYNNGYGNMPAFMMHQGSHYVGNTFPSPASSNDPNTKPFDENTSMLNPNGASNDYQQDLTGSSNNNNNDDTLTNPDTGGAEITGSASDNLEHYGGSEIDENSILAAENSENKKIGIMDQFDLFYKEYKILTWVAVFLVTSLCFLTLLVYLYINNPPTEVVQARQLFPWDALTKNPQIVKFLSSFVDSRYSRSDPGDSEYLKPYGKGFGGKSGKQKRKQTRGQMDRNKMVQRRDKLNRIRGNSNKKSTTKVPQTQTTTTTTSEPVTKPIV